MSSPRDRARRPITPERLEQIKKHQAIKKKMLDRGILKMLK